jgi:hypothetical protein
MNPLITGVLDHIVSIIILCVTHAANVVHVHVNVTVMKKKIIGMVFRHILKLTVLYVWNMEEN